MKYYKLTLVIAFTGAVIYYISKSDIQMATFYLGLIILNNQK